MTKKRIIIVDNESLMSHLVKEFIDETGDLEVSAMATDSASFFNSILQGTFDLALIDISIGSREGGMEILKSLKDRNIPLPVVIFSAHDEILYAQRCLQLGASGYINKASVTNDLIRGLREVLEGRLFVSGSKGEKILEKFRIGLS